MFTKIIKRDGREVEYDLDKIVGAISKAMEASQSSDEGESLRMAKLVEAQLCERFGQEAPGVEDIQDIVELVLMDNGYSTVS